MLTPVSVHKPPPVAPPVRRPHAQAPQGTILCPRPSCGGRLLAVDLDLEETTLVCILCSRAPYVAYGAAPHEGAWS